jgi:glyoxylase-like metal-dependent hydrolase (beta-lactamase superfamily II)
MAPSRKSVWKAEVLLHGSWRGATAVLLSNDHHHLVVDTGMPHEAHLLLQALKERGLEARDIRGVINTHFHIDHVLNNCLFTGAQFYASQESYEWCGELYTDLRDETHWEKLALKYYPETHEYDRSRRYMEKLRKLALRWWDVKRLGPRRDFHWLETQPLPEGLERIITSGHVPGHASLIVHGPDRPLVIAGDALLSRQHEERVLTMIPHKRAQYQRDRALILQKAPLIIPGHDQPFEVAESFDPPAPEE